MNNLIISNRNKMDSLNKVGKWLTEPSTAGIQTVIILGKKHESMKLKGID